MKEVNVEFKSNINQGQRNNRKLSLNRANSAKNIQIKNKYITI